MFRVVKSARNLRPVVSALVVSGEVAGCSLNYDLSLTHLMKKESAFADYLTLLVHLGVLSVHDVELSGRHVFKCASGAYRKSHLDPLLEALKESIDGLVKLSLVDDIYEQGVPLIVDFLSTLSKNCLGKSRAKEPYYGVAIARVHGWKFAQGAL